MEKRPMRIIVAVDGSPCSDAAVAEVGRRPWPTGSEFKVVSAFQIPMSPTPEVWAIPPDYYNQLEHAAQSQAQTIVDLSVTKLMPTLGESMIVLGEILSGSPQAAILEEADEWHADLIVVGSHDYRAWQRLVLGSVSQAVVLHAKCSVEVVRCQQKVSVVAA
jgi:nucleotide-binding universal stress UspA family protein